VLALSLTPAIEWAFNYTTDLKLLELANLNHPALKELIVQAPGSYHHSIIVGALVEAAAESVGSNPLLARVMAYYHDLGKGCNPGYFIENQRTGHNPHDKLKPSMSAMIIRRHVTDGIELAKRHGLGEQILSGIAQHHGNTLIHFFYHKAKEQADDDQIVNEGDYRYPGQKPQSREAALVMLGDSIEAASRSLADPTSARLQGLVNRIISHKFTDGQLEECDLTLRDLHTIAKSFSRVLNSIYHHRLEYPDILKDITGNAGKKQHGDTDTKSSKRPEGADGSTEEDPPDNLRRLGL
jgi:putative nucleotidyltransferase with HDIG domain